MKLKNIKKNNKRKPRKKKYMMKKYEKERLFTSIINLLLESLITRNKKVNKIIRKR